MIFFYNFYEIILGYYADVGARCQVFRICANTANDSGKGFGFLCPNGTLFNQEFFVCDWYMSVNCENSERYYGLNDLIGQRMAQFSYGDYISSARDMIMFPMIASTVNNKKTTGMGMYKDYPRPMSNTLGIDSAVKKNNGFQTKVDTVAPPTKFGFQDNEKTVLGETPVGPQVFVNSLGQLSTDSDSGFDPKYSFIIKPNADSNFDLDFPLVNHHLSPTPAPSQTVGTIDISGPPFNGYSPQSERRNDLLPGQKQIYTYPLNVIGQNGQNIQSNTPDLQNLIGNRFDMKKITPGVPANIRPQLPSAPGSFGSPSTNRIVKPSVTITHKETPFTSTQSKYTPSNTKNQKTSQPATGFSFGSVDQNSISKPSQAQQPPRTNSPDFKFGSQQDLRPVNQRVGARVDTSSVPQKTYPSNIKTSTNYQPQGQSSINGQPQGQSSISGQPQGHSTISGQPQGQSLISGQPNSQLNSRPQTYSSPQSQNPSSTSFQPPSQYNSRPNSPTQNLITDGPTFTNRNFGNQQNLIPVNQKFEDRIDSGTGPNSNGIKTSTNYQSSNQPQGLAYPQSNRQSRPQTSSNQFQSNPQKSSSPQSQTNTNLQNLNSVESPQSQGSSQNPPVQSLSFQPRPHNPQSTSSQNPSASQFQSRPQTYSSPNAQTYSNSPSNPQNFQSTSSQNPSANQFLPRPQTYSSPNAYSNSPSSPQTQSNTQYQTRPQSGPQQQQYSSNSKSPQSPTSQNGPASNRFSTFSQPQSSLSSQNPNNQQQTSTDPYRNMFSPSFTSLLDNIMVIHHNKMKLIDLIQHLFHPPSTKVRVTGAEVVQSSPILEFSFNSDQGSASDSYYSIDRNPYRNCNN